MLQQTRLFFSSGGDLNGSSLGVEADEDDGSGSIWRGKYERTAKELEYTKKLLQSQHEEDLEQMMAIKKQLEKKVRQIPNIFPITYVSFHLLKIVHNFRVFWACQITLVFS